MANLTFVKSIVIPNMTIGTRFIDSELYASDHPDLVIQVLTSASGRVGWIYQEWDYQIPVTGNWRRLYRDSQFYKLERMRSSFRLGFSLYRGLTDIEIKIWKDS